MAEPVWQQSVDDGVYTTRVDRRSDYAGVLTVTRTEDGALILVRDVTLSYQALFGPDVADVALWQEMVITAIDEDYRNRGMEVPES